MSILAQLKEFKERFIENSYFSLIKSHLKKSGLFISNLCSSAELDNPKNIFFQKFKKIYFENFNSVRIFKGNYSDKIYYKSFFNLDERVIDITNIILISSLKEIKFLPNKISLMDYFKSKFTNIDINSILNDEVT